jgi:hypothetical protein
MASRGLETPTCFIAGGFSAEIHRHFSQFCNQTEVSSKFNLLPSKYCRAGVGEARPSQYFSVLRGGSLKVEHLDEVGIVGEHLQIVVIRRSTEADGVAKLLRRAFHRGSLAASRGVLEHFLTTFDRSRLCDNCHQPLLRTTVKPGRKGFGFVTGTPTPVMK